MKRCILLLSMLCVVSVAISQDFKPSFYERAPTIAVAVPLITFAYNTAEIDIDLRLAERQWLTIAPRLQFGKPEGDGYYYDAMDAIKKGFGLGLNYRYFPLTRSAKHYSDGVGPFVSAGIRGQATTYEYRGQQSYYYDYYETDHSLVSVDAPYYSEDIWQIGAEVNIGYSMRFFDILFAEAYIGMGAKYSNYDYDEGYDQFNLGGDSWDTGYTGYCLTGGLRIGIFLNKYTR